MRKEKDPVLTAYNNSQIDWIQVLNSVQNPKGRKYEMHPDTLSYADEYLKNKGIPDEQRAVILGNMFIESGGRPSRGSETGPNPIYYGLLQWDKERLPIRKTGLSALNQLLDHLVKTIKSKKSPHWSDGGKGTGFQTLEQAYNIFWGDPEETKAHLIPKRYNLLRSDLNLIGQAFVDGYIRPEDRITDNQNRAIASKIIYKNIKSRAGK